jgi:hypothetical protein
LNGNEWRDWFRAGDLDWSTGEAGGHLRVTVQDGVADAFYVPPVAAAALELHVAILGFDVSTSVEAGENRGRDLKHDFVVLAYGRTLMKPEDGRFVTEFRFPGVDFEAPETAIAAWISAPRDPRPLQAAGGWLK